MSLYDHSKSYEAGQKLQTTVRLEADTFAEVDKIMLNTGVSRAEVIRRLVNNGLENMEPGFQEEGD